MNYYSIKFDVGFNMTEWANEKGIATELNIGEFIQSVGGKRITDLPPSIKSENADYIFFEKRVIIELKILETELGETTSFQTKEHTLHEDMARRFSAGQIIRMERAPREFYAARRLEFYRAPLARIAKKANRQIKATKETLSIPDFRGILWLVNDNLRNVGADLVFGVMCRILNGSNSQIRALIYVTNHYVDMPGSNYAHLLWAPAYVDSAADNLPDFVNWLGSAWGDFLESKIGLFDDRREGSDLTIIGVRPIR